MKKVNKFEEECLGVKVLALARTNDSVSYSLYLFLSVLCSIKYLTCKYFLIN